MQELRECRRCKRWKPLGFFVAEAKCRKGRRHECAACHYRHAIRGAPSQASAGMERVTVEQEAARRASQGGRCALCRRELRKHVVDHDHATGRVRGLLCYRCNQMLALFDRDPGALERVRAYLAR